MAISFIITSRWGQHEWMIDVSWKGLHIYLKFKRLILEYYWIRAKHVVISKDLYASKLSNPHTNAVENVNNITSDQQRRARERRSLGSANKRRELDWLNTASFISYSTTRLLNIFNVILWIHIFRNISAW